MARKVTVAQFNQLLRQAQQKQKQAISRYNDAVRKYNGEVKRSIDNYNRGVREYNTRLRAHQQRINSELSKLNRLSLAARQTTTYRSTVVLNRSYQYLERTASNDGSYYDHLVSLAENENANSLEVANAIEQSPAVHNAPPFLGLQDTKIEDQLRSLSMDLDQRWRGAVYALSPHNPDASRHFCTSAREILTQIIEISAPDTVVFQALDDYEVTDRGNPTRRSKVRYMLKNKGIEENAMEDFIVNDIDNLLSLFPVLNDGTHGSAGRFDYMALSSIKKRVEDGIIFLLEVAN